MYQLNMEKLIQGIEREEPLSKDGIWLEKEIDKGDFILFLRIMKAREPKEISDISTEKIISLYDKSEDFAAYFADKPDVVYQSGIKLKKMRSTISRRIL